MHLQLRHLLRRVAAMAPHELHITAPHELADVLEGREAEPHGVQAQDAQHLPRARCDPAGSPSPWRSWWPSPGRAAAAVGPGRPTGRRPAFRAPPWPRGPARASAPRAATGGPTSRGRSGTAPGARPAQRPRTMKEFKKLADCIGCRFYIGIRPFAYHILAVKAKDSPSSPRFRGTSSINRPP